MKETMGQIIRRLRKEKNLTQDEMAEQLNISAQAVSKWENGSSMPDISQVVPLANFFGVSTDLLFGIQGLDRDEEVKRIIEEASAPQRLSYDTEEEEFQVSVKEYETYVEALKLHPNSIPLLYAALSSGGNLARDYAERGDSRQALKIRKESIRIGNIILHTCNDTATLLDTHRWMVWIFCDMKEYENAEEHAGKMSKGYDNQGSMKAWIRLASGDIDGEIKQRCNNISGMIFAIHFEIVRLGNAYCKKGQYEDAIRVYKALYDLIPVIYGDEEFTPPLHTLGIGDHIALCYVKLGQNEEAVKWLSKTVDHLSKNAKQYNKQDRVETPILRECEYRFFGNSMRVKDHVDLDRPEFEPLGKYSMFKELVEKVNK